MMGNQVDGHDSLALLLSRSPYNLEAISATNKAMQPLRSIERSPSAAISLASQQSGFSGGRNSRDGMEEDVTKKVTRASCADFDPQRSDSRARSRCCLHTDSGARARARASSRADADLRFWRRIHHGMSEFTLPYPTLYGDHRGYLIIESNPEPPLKTPPSPALVLSQLPFRYCCYLRTNEPCKAGVGLQLAAVAPSLSYLCSTDKFSCSHAAIVVNTKARVPTLIARFTLSSTTNKQTVIFFSHFFWSTYLELRDGIFCDLFAGVAHHDGHPS